jgi:hypothetical protein
MTIDSLKRHVTRLRLRRHLRQMPYGKTATRITDTAIALVIVIGAVGLLDRWHATTALTDLGLGFALGWTVTTIWRKKP